MLFQLCIYLSFFITTLSTFSLPNFPNECNNSTCLNESLKITLNDSDCLSWNQWPNILKPKNFTASGKQCYLLNEESQIHVCPKIINGKKFLASCGESSADYRIPCIPISEEGGEEEKDSLQWYRGIKSTTFNGTKCLRWDEIEFIGQRFSAFFDFSETPFGSQTYGIHSHENFCRNPDSLSAGPWCYIKGGNTPMRQPCFLQCLPNSTEPNFSFEPVLLQNETNYHPFSQKNRNHSLHVSSENFEDQLDTGTPTSTILLLTISFLALIAALVICILHACNKI